ncbi:MAG: ArsR family transcriptional regulator [Treponema sp.]|nr:ArsR family transcriptional regulator [Treponema sp.]
MAEDSVIESYKEKRKKAVAIFESLSPFFVALGDKVRQKIMMDVACGADVGVNVTYLTRKARLSRPAVSYHIRILRECGLIKPVKYGTQVFYKMNIAENFSQITDFVKMIETLIELKKEVDKKREAVENEIDL